MRCSRHSAVRTWIRARWTRWPDRTSCGATERFAARALGDERFGVVGEHDPVLTEVLRRIHGGVGAAYELADDAVDLGALAEVLRAGLGETGAADADGRAALLVDG